MLACCDFRALEEAVERKEDGGREERVVRVDVGRGKGFIGIQPPRLT